jgi:hypothetical protein
MQCNRFEFARFTPLQARGQECPRHTNLGHLTGSELEPAPLTVYKDIGSRNALGRACGVCHADYGVPSNGLQLTEAKAEVVELADTPS